MLVATAWSTVVVGLGLVALSLIIHFAARRGSRPASRWQLLLLPEWLLLLPGLVLSAYVVKVLNAPDALVSVTSFVAQALDLGFAVLLVVTLVRLVLRLVAAVAAKFRRPAQQ